MFRSPKLKSYQDLRIEPMRSVTQSSSDVSCFISRLDSISDLTLKIYLPPSLYASVMDAVDELTQILTQNQDCLNQDSSIPRKVRFDGILDPKN